MAHPSEPAVRELIERGIELARSYAIFSELGYAYVKDTPGYRDHVDFFEATANAHLQSCFVIVYLLYDKRRGVKSIPHIAKQLSGTRPKTIERIHREIAESAPLLNKLFAVRGAVFAHRDGSASPGEVLFRTNLPGGFLRKGVNLASRHLSALGSLCRIDTLRELRSEFSRREQYAREDTRLVLAAAGRKDAL